MIIAIHKNINWIVKNSLSLHESYVIIASSLINAPRDHLFRQTSDTGTPWLDMSHIVQSLNKLDIGSSERFLLTSHDNQNVLVVSYSDMKKATSKCFAEIINQSHL